MRVSASFLMLCLFLGFVTSGAHADQEINKNEPIVLAPGYSPLQFKAPLPGSYELPPLGEAKDGAVLDSKNESHNLYDFYGDKVVLLSFIYASCSDVNGCPLATTVFHKIQHHLKKIGLLLVNFGCSHLVLTPNMTRQMQ